MQPVFERLARLAYRSDNVVGRRDLLAINFTDERIALMVARRYWQRLHPGVFLIGAAKPTWRQQARAAAVAASSAAYLDAESALVWWQIPGVDEHRLIHVGVERAKGPTPAGAVIHRRRRPVTTVQRDGVRVASVEDALLAYAAHADRRQVEQAVEASLLSRRTSERRLWRVVALNSRKGVRGVALLRTVLEGRPNGKPARSVLEIEVLQVIRSAGLPLPRRNYDTVDGNGEAREIDLCYVEVRGAIEADSKAFHSTRSQTEDDRRRQRALEAVGYRFVRITWADVFERPDWISSQVRSLLGGFAHPSDGGIRPENAAA